MSAIFISHSSSDEAFAVQIKAKLLEQGHRSLFLDFDPAAGIPAGRNWERELYTRLRECQAVIALCTEHFVTSKWCFAEITQARAQGKHLFPMKFAPCQVPSLLSDVQVIDLTVDRAEGYERLWAGLRKVGLDPADLFDWDGSRPPYPGLLAFQEQDAAIYFGRDTAIQAAVETLNRVQRFNGSRLVLVLGASGSGKSSLLRAGVVPRLRRVKDRWLVLDPFRPLGRPFDELAMVLAAAFHNFDDNRDWRSIRDVLSGAHDAPEGRHLLDLADDLRVAAGRREATVLLAIDQFEELLRRDSDQADSLFLQTMKAILSQRSSPFVVAATLRSDFLGAFQLHAAVGDLPYEPFPLPQIALSDLAQVIEGPARVAGLELEAGLAQAMVADTATDDGLPLLAFTLRRLWDEYGADGVVNVKEYRQTLGGLQGSLARAAENVFVERKLTVDEQLLLRRAFLSMVRVDEEGRYVRRPVAWREMPEGIHDVLESFVQARLLVSRSEDLDRTDRILEVAHEALFRSWDRLVSWLNADREFLLWIQRLRSDLAEWQRTGRDEASLLRGQVLGEAERWAGERLHDLAVAEREFIKASVVLREDERIARERLRRRNTTIALCAMGILAAVSAIAGWQWWRADQQGRIALARHLASQAEMTIAQTSRNPADLLERGLLLATESLRLLASAQTDVVMRRSLALLPRTVTRVDHNAKTIAFSGDGQYLALESDSIDQIVVREAFSHRELARVPHQSFGVIAFSPDGKLLATTTDDVTTHVWEVATGRPIFSTTHEEEVERIVFSADGKFVVTVTNDDVAHVWEAQSGRLASRIRHDDSVTAIAFSPDGQRLSTATYDAAYMWEASTGRMQFRIPHEEEIRGLVFSPDGEFLAMTGDEVENEGGNSRSTIEIRNSRTGEIHRRLVCSIPFQSWSRALAYRFDGRYIAATGKNEAHVWEVESGREVHMPHDGEVGVIAFSPDRVHFATTGDDSSARLWGLNGRELAVMQHQDRVTELAFSRDGQYLATASVGGTAVKWAVPYAGGASLHVLPENLGVGRRMAFSSNGKWLASLEDYKAVRVWETASGRELYQVRHERRSEPGFAFMTDVAFSPDGRYLATIADDYTMRLWDPSSGREVLRRQYKGPLYPTSLAFSGDGQYVAAGGENVHVWEIAAGRLVSQIEEEVSPRRMALSHDGKYLTTFLNDAGSMSSFGNSTAHVWDVSSGRELARISDEALPEANVIATSVDGLKVATASKGKNAKVWDALTGREMSRMSHEGVVRAVAFSPDGRSLVTGSDDKTARVWDLSSGREIVRMPHQVPVFGIALSPDGKQTATVAYDGLHLWETFSGRELSRLGSSTGVDAAVFSADGSYLATRGTIISVWLLRATDLIDDACSRLTRNLTEDEWQTFVGNRPYRRTCANVPGHGKIQ